MDKKQLEQMKELVKIQGDEWVKECVNTLKLEASGIDELLTRSITITNGKIEPAVPTIYFKGRDDLEIMRLEPNGNIYVHGNLVENDLEVVEGLRKFIMTNGY